MVEKAAPLEMKCSFANSRPAMVDLPYPPLRAQCKNMAYANLLSVDYCGSVSELSAITQYINSENRLSDQNCTVAQTILGIAIAEMMHLQKLGGLIVLLGGSLDYSAKLQNGKQVMWTPAYLTLSDNWKQMLAIGIESEKAAIMQYRAHIKMIQDTYINAVLNRIIQDEEYHIMLLSSLLKS